jgi:hypothetical protein
MILTIFDFKIIPRGIMSYNLLPMNKIHKITFIDNESDAIDAPNEYFVIIKQEPLLTYYFKIKKSPESIYF